MDEESKSINEETSGEEVKEAEAAKDAEAAEPEKPKKEKASRGLKKELEKAQAERDEYLDALKRERADFENYKKRNAAAVSKAYADGTADAVTAILPVIDNFERAAAAPCSDEAYKSGMDLVHRQLTDAVKNMGAEEIESEGKPFDPNLHNAVMQVPCEEGDESGTVKTVLMKGYKIGDKVIRHAMVQVTE